MRFLLFTLSVPLDCWLPCHREDIIMVLQPLQIGDKIVIVGGTRERRLVVDKIDTEPNESRWSLNLNLQS